MLFFLLFSCLLNYKETFKSYIDWICLMNSLFNGVEGMLSFHVSSCLNIDIYMSIETFINTAVAGIHLASNQNIIIDHSLFKSRFSADVWKCKDSLWIFLSITLKVFVLLLLHFHKVVWKLYFFSMIILLSLHSMD